MNNNLYFFPTSTKQILESAGCEISKYDYSYKTEGLYVPLRGKGQSIIKLEDSRETWKVEDDGLRIIRKVSFEHFPSFLGKNGLACKGAQLGVCIIWTNKYLSQMGYILPEKENKQGLTDIFLFSHEFCPGQIQGDLTLDTVLYIKHASPVIEEGEEVFINEAGVVIGLLDSVVLNFNSIYMDFPIQEVNEKDQPLWWIEFHWEDPKSDRFDEDHVCLFLNTYYSCCPKVGSTIKNVDILIEILSSSYFLIFKKLEEMNCLSDTVNDVDLEPCSIAKVMQYFYGGCNPSLRTGTLEELQKTIHINIERMVLQGTEE